ncbi:TetR family transcriptional regulator [Frankia sp. CcI49]|uniref:TetR family transcriptional regulator n=1 Tax=unclassified Frankia TaxID=2632575 RepID=UPI0006CA520A|nr:TetR family transcriptional regulator [Frankia sp. R43]ONH62063.1 TetR family transcriptional regulator [Frankia sp. CcI49]
MAADENGHALTRIPEASRADATRARLLAAALDAFATKGFHGTTTRDIAAAAGMSSAALYVHHKSKEELLYLISLTGHQRTLARLRAALAHSDDPVEQLRRVAQTFAESHARDHTTARVVNYELAALSSEHREEIHAIRREIAAEIGGIVQRGVAAKVFVAPDPAMTATALVSLAIDIGRWYRDDGSWTPAEIGRRYAELSLRMVGAALP